MTTKSVILICALLTLLCSASYGSAPAQSPEWRSGASIEVGVPVNFNTLAQRVGAVYDVVENDDKHIIWKFSDTTGDWAFVFADGRVIIASTVEFDLAAKDILENELNDVMDMLNAVGGGITSDSRSRALQSVIYYARDRDIYQKLEYTFKNNFDLYLKVPECAVKKARIKITNCDGGEDYYNSDSGQAYSIDDKEILSCFANDYLTKKCCDLSLAEITDKILSGRHQVSARRINNEHTMIIEAITSPEPPKNFVLYSSDYKTWINETSRSMNLEELQKILYRQA